MVIKELGFSSQVSCFVPGMMLRYKLLMMWILRLSFLGGRTNEISDVRFFVPTRSGFSTNPPRSLCPRSEGRNEASKICPIDLPCGGRWRLIEMQMAPRKRTERPRDDVTLPRPPIQAFRI